MRPEMVRIDDIYVPVKRRKELNQETVDALAESILEQGQQSPIGIRPDKGRYVLVSGLHRLEACRALGEEMIEAVVVQARKY